MNPSVSPGRAALYQPSVARPGFDDHQNRSAVGATLYPCRPSGGRTFEGLIDLVDVDQMPNQANLQ